MMGWSIGTVLLVMFLLLMVLSACKVSAAADAQAERNFHQMMERRFQNAALRKEVITDD